MSSPATPNQTQDPERQKRDHRQRGYGFDHQPARTGCRALAEAVGGCRNSDESDHGQALSGWQCCSPDGDGSAVRLRRSALDDVQASENDWQGKKGEKGTRIAVWEVKRASDEQVEPSQAPAEAAEKPERRFIHKI